MTEEMPTAASVAAELGSLLESESEGAATETPAPSESPEVSSAPAGTEKAQAAPKAESEPTKSAEPTGAAPATETKGAAPPKAASLADLINEEVLRQGARKFFDSLPEETKTQVAKEFYPGLQRLVQKKHDTTVELQTALRSQAQTILGEVQRELLENREELVEVLTQGLGEQERTDLRTKLDAGRVRRAEERRARQPQMTAEEYLRQNPDAAAMVNAVWSAIVEESGIAPDPNDPIAKAAWAVAFHEPDVTVAIDKARDVARRLSGKSAQPAGQAQAAAGSQPQASQDVFERILAAVGEKIDQSVQTSLREAGIFTADTGRPGGAPGEREPETIQEAGLQARDLLRRELGRSR